MLLFSPAYLFFAFLLIVAFALGVMISQKRKKEEAPQPAIEKKVEILPFVEQMLRCLNCSFTHQEKEAWHEYSFKYQNGNFILLCRENDSLLRIHYPHFFSTNIDNLDLVREVCNTCNSHGFSHHIVYTADGKQNTLSLHITSALAVVNDSEGYTQQLADILSHFFNLGQEFYLRFDKGKERYKDVSPYDAEENNLKYEREFFMLREMELKHQPSKETLVASSSHSLSIAKLLRNIYGWAQPEFLELKIVTHELRSIVNEKEIADFDISQVLVAINAEGKPNFIGRNATLILTFSYDREHQQCFPQQMVISLKNEGCTSESLYQRATLSMHPIAPHNRNSEYDKENGNRAFSFIFAFDIVDRKEILEKVEKKLQSLAEKCENSDFVHLTQDEILAFKFDNPDVQFYKHHADSLFRQKRFYEAITELEYLYNYLSPRYLELQKKNQQTFYEICYFLGYSYCALGLNKRAYYYLDAVCPLNHLTYMEEYVNCLVNAKDFRALSIIENMEAMVNGQQTDSEGRLSDSLQHFINFLKRRKAHHLVDLGYYEKAKELFQAMYQEPENQDYALNELAYLQKLCGKSHHDDSETPNSKME